MKNLKKINALERDKIGVWLAEKMSLRAIARNLGRSVSTISDEVRRNSVGGVYQPNLAQFLSVERNKASRKLNPLKSPFIYAYVVRKLRDGWSPEQIAGRLKKNRKGKTVLCHETIYRYIYSEPGKEKDLSQYLVRSHFRRKRWHSRNLYHRGIANRTSIRLRPEEIETRNTFGHWETDIVEGAKPCWREKRGSSKDNSSPRLIPSMESGHRKSFSLNTQKVPLKVSLWITDGRTITTMN